MQWENTRSLQHVSKDLDGRIMAIKITLKPWSKSIIYSQQYTVNLEKYLKNMNLRSCLKIIKLQNWKNILTILWLWFGEWHLKSYNTRSSFNGIKCRCHYTHLREVYFHFNCNDLAFSFPEMFSSSFFCTFQCLITLMLRCILNSCITYEILLLIDSSSE